MQEEHHILIPLIERFTDDPATAYAVLVVDRPRWTRWSTLAQLCLCMKQADEVICGLTRRVQDLVLYQAGVLEEFFADRAAQLSPGNLQLIAEALAETTETNEPVLIPETFKRGQLWADFRALPQVSASLQYQEFEFADFTRWSIDWKLWNDEDDMPLGSAQQLQFQFGVDYLTSLDRFALNEFPLVEREETETT